MRISGRRVAFLLAVALEAGLAGCSSVQGLMGSSSDTTTAEPSVAAAPSKKAIAAAANSAAQTAKLEKPIEISNLRPSPPSAPEPWMVCLRSGKTPASRRVNYSLFFNGDTMKSFNLAAIIFDCEGESYSPVK